MLLFREARGGPLAGTLPSSFEERCVSGHPQNTPMMRRRGRKGGSVGNRWEKGLKGLGSQVEHAATDQNLRPRRELLSIHPDSVCVPGLKNASERTSYCIIISLSHCFSGYEMGTVCDAADACSCCCPVKSSPMKWKKKGQSLITGLLNGSSRASHDDDDQRRVVCF